jgi:hypothetical protein
MNALVANAKSPPSLAVMRSLGRKGIDVTGASDDKVDFPLFSKYCRKKILLSTPAGNFEVRLDELLNIVKNNKFDAFLPVMSEGVDEKDWLPKIIDVNPRFYGPLQCAISAGADFPYSVYKMAINGDIETDLSYKEGVTFRNLLYADTNHMMSVMRGMKSPKYTLGKFATLCNYLNFFNDNSDFILSFADSLPALKKILRFI